MPPGGQPGRGEGMFSIIGVVNGYYTTHDLNYTSIK
jgi:hypothetical protein